MRRLLLVLLLCPLFWISCYADTTLKEGASALDAEKMEQALDKSERSVSGSVSADGSYDYEGAIGRLLHRLYEAAAAEYKVSLKTAASITVLSVLCSLLSAMCSDKKYAAYIGTAGCCAVSLMTLSGVDSIMAQAVGAITRLSDYSKAAMPVVFTAAAAAGAVKSAAAKYAAVCLSLDVLISLSQKLVIPCVYAFLALSVANSLFENSIVRTCAGFVRWAATTAMTVLTLAFGAYIALTGLIAGSTDAAAVKAARSVISTALPVVGGIISDSASVILSAAGIIKNAVGAFGLISVCVLCAGPFAALGVKLLMYKAAAALSAMSSIPKLTGLVNDVCKAIGMLLGMVGCCGIMLFISLMSAIKAAV